jgi:acyl carrier protein
MTEEAQLLEFVNARLARNGPVQDPALDLMAARIIDSMGMLELVVWMEQTFGVRVKNEDLVAANFRSVGALAGYIRRSRPAG